MEIHKLATLTPYARMKYKAHGEFDPELSKTLISGILTAVASSNKISTDGIAWLLEEQLLVGVPADIIGQIRKTDFSSLALTDALPDPITEIPEKTRRVMTYQALHVCFHKSNKLTLSTARKIAARFAVDDDQTRTIRRLVLAEKRTDSLRQHVLMLNDDDDTNVQ